MKISAVKKCVKRTKKQGNRSGIFAHGKGMMRHYDAKGLTDGYVGDVEYIYDEDDTGILKVLEDRRGVRNLEQN